MIVQLNDCGPVDGSGEVHLLWKKGLEIVFGIIVCCTPLLPDTCMPVCSYSKCLDVGDGPLEPLQ